MFDDYAKELLRNGIIEARAGNRDVARRYLERAIYASYNSDHKLMAEAWFWMSQVLDDPAGQRRALESALSHDLRHAPARRALAVLDGKLQADEIVDPDHLPPAPRGLQAADAQRFMCPKCGGRMVFTPDGQALVCEYCTRRQPLASDPVGAGDKDFIIAMATLRGHGKPLNEQVFQCQGCGAQFILPPGQLSAACVYCDSPHVVRLEHSKDLLAPDAILPHAFDQSRAASLLAAWVESSSIRPERQMLTPRGLYLPLWSFAVGGVIDYTGETQEVEDQGFPRGEIKTVRVHDQMPVIAEDVPIPASRKLSAVFIRLIPGFDLKSMQTYDARYLADWPAELYDIPMAEASLDARSHVYARYKRDLPHQLNPIRLLSTSSANLTVESFRLILLPIWMTEVAYAGRARLVLINGQNGDVHADRPQRSVG